MDRTATINISPVLIAAVVLITSLCLLILIQARQILYYKRMAMRDSVTGSLSREGFLRVTQKYLTTQKNRGVVVTMRLCNLSQITQTFGCRNADRVLSYLHSVLTANLSSSEPIARIDGDTFCFLLKNRQEDAIRARLDRICESANRFNQNPLATYPLELLFGICIPDAPQSSVDEILKKTTALLEKQARSSRYHFIRASAENDPARNRSQIDQMEQALENGEFIAFMQPKIRLSDNRIIGAEALIRWRHPQRGMLTPDMFISLLDEYHLLPKYDLYLFEQVCRQMAHWIRQNWTPLPVSINLSHDTLHTPSFAGGYAEICRKYGIAPELIELELPESILLESPSEIVRIVEQIHSFNFRCALDNFGRSTISLSALRELNVDTIKLDQFLFSGENNNRRNRFVVEAILKLSTQLQIRTVAEGIDNASQVQYLKQAGCDVIQGYYYFQPMSMEEFCIRVFRKGQPGYVESPETNALRAQIPARRASKKITMFSLQTATDRVTFSELFTPVQEEHYALSNATSLFQYSSLIHENDRQDFLLMLSRCQKESGWIENTIRFYTSNGRYEWMEVHMHGETVPSGEGMVISGTLVNMTSWNSEVNRWKEKANRDALTDLYNREYFEQFTSDVLKKGKLSSAALIFIDVDDFKKVNDTLGHIVGDDVLRSISKRLQSAFRQTDIIARYGGDEFVIFANGIGKEELSKRLQKVCESFRMPYRNGSVEHPVSVSLGAVMFPDNGHTYEELLDHADTAAYVAKHRGKNRFIFYHPDFEDIVQ